MWDDFKIGEGDSSNSAVFVYGLEEHGLEGSISHNYASYWISHAFLNVGFRIMKNTDEGKQLTKLLEVPEARDPKKICAFLDRLVLTHMSPTKLRVKIKEAMKESFHEGRKFQAAEFRKALSI